MQHLYQDQKPGFLFYDYETFGINPAYDRIAQFGAIRTDENLELQDEPEVFYCQPGSDTLPHPDACLLTTITPQLALSKGLCEWEFASRINELMSRPNTCALGYNIGAKETGFFVPPMELTIIRWYADLRVGR